MFNVKSKVYWLREINSLLACILYRSRIDWFTHVRYTCNIQPLYYCKDRIVKTINKTISFNCFYLLYSCYTVVMKLSRFMPKIILFSIASTVSSINAVEFDSEFLYVRKHPN